LFSTEFFEVDNYIQDFDKVAYKHNCLIRSKETISERRTISRLI